MKLGQAMHLQHTIKAVIRTGEQSGYVAECMEIPVATQGDTLEETVANLREAIDLHLEGEEPAAFGLTTNSTVAVTMELKATHANSHGFA